MLVALQMTMLESEAARLRAASESEDEFRLVPVH